jgi:hypothetical protein
MLIEFIREQVMEGLINFRKMLTKLIVSKTFTIKAMHLLGEMGMSLNVNKSCDELNFKKE